ncbi:MAG: hypothetical protein QX189_07430 [Methylococcales bacterium]
MENDWILSSSTKLVSAKYSKQGFTHGVLACGYHQIGKLQGVRQSALSLTLANKKPKVGAKAMTEKWFSVALVA